MKRPRKQPWKMSKEQSVLWPDIAGNTINGLSETSFRRPTMVYWPNSDYFDYHATAIMPHGKLSVFMSKRSATTAPEISKVYMDSGNRAPSEYIPIAPEQLEDMPSNWASTARSLIGNMAR